MRLSDLIPPEAVVPELKAADRNGVIREMVAALADCGRLNPADAELLARAAIARENQGSTGFGRGVAVPHVKHERVPRMVATVGRSSVGVDFAALDRAPVYTVFLLLSPAESPEQHLAVMERIFRYLQRENFRRFLRQADTQQAILDIIREADDQQDDS
jgi:mannitol/fructose-specific phosphotransferase system IIA component (Ntr-type)